MSNIDKTSGKPIRKEIAWDKESLQYLVGEGFSLKISFTEKRSQVSSHASSAGSMCVIGF